MSMLFHFVIVYFSRIRILFQFNYTQAGHCVEHTGNINPGVLFSRNCDDKMKSAIIFSHLIENSSTFIFQSVCFVDFCFACREQRRACTESFDNAFVLTTLFCI